MSSNFSDQSNLDAIRKLSDSSLLETTKDLAHKERELLTVVLRHLREVKRRRLYSVLRYRSMLEYAVQELKYSEDQAYRRLTAMELLTEVPELEEKINQGSLSLSNINVAVRTFRAESKASGQKVEINRKVEIRKAVENKSRREAECIVQHITTAPMELLKPETTRVVQDHLEIRLNLPQEMEDKINRIKAHLSHAHPHLSTSELFIKLVDEYLAKIDKRRQPLASAVAQSSMSGEASQNLGKNSAPNLKHCAKAMTESLRFQSRARRIGVKPRSNISVKIRREVFQRAGHRCENCQSERFLELEHCEPVALGGKDDATNLRVLCRSCNQRRAIESFGQVKMSEFF